MSSTSTPSSPSLTRSPDFWFDDGSIILQVETTQFRVHRSIICANSVIFRDMHELSEPGRRDNVDGCPVVVLHGDTVADWSNLLQYMYFPLKASKSAEHLAFPLVVSLLRLGRKYQFTDIWALARHTVQIQVPVDDVESWDAFLQDDIHFTRGIPGLWLQGHEMDLLNLAIEHGLQTILPIAYYLCIHRYPLDQILSGKRRDDGSLYTVHPNALHTLLIGRQKLQSAYYRIAMSWITDSDVISSEDCEQESTDDASGLRPCELSRKRAFEKLVAVDMDSVGALSPLDPDWFSDFCEDCSEKILEKNDMQRWQIWFDLPSYFDLPTWSELKDAEC